jgi:hypothetical protein
MQIGHFPGSDPVHDRDLSAEEVHVATTGALAVDNKFNTSLGGGVSCAMDGPAHRHTKTTRLAIHSHHFICTLGFNIGLFRARSAGGKS